MFNTNVVLQARYFRTYIKYRQSLHNSNRSTLSPDDLTPLYTITNMTTLNVVVTGSSGRIAYSLIPFICMGETFGPDTCVNLRLLDIEQCQEKNEGVKMEILDSAYPLVQTVTTSIDPAVAFKDADVAILLGGFPRLPGMLRKDLIAKNVAIMLTQSKALEQYAKKDVKVVVVANPANTNCLIASQAAPSIPARNFTCLLRLDHDRLLGMLAAEINTKSVGEFIHPGKIRGVAVFGNHSNTQVPHIAGGEVNVGGEWKPIVDYIDAEWADNVLPSRLQNRGADIIKHLQASSGQSAARAISRHLQDWLGPVTTPGHIFSMGVISTGNLYDGIPEGLMFSFPCTRAVGSAPGDYSIVYDGFSVPNNPLHIAAIKATVDELNEEKSAAEAFLGDR